MSSASEASSSGSASAATIVTLEGRTLQICLDESGVRIVSSDSGGDCPYEHYDSVNSLLLNNSPGFTAKFNASLASLLQGVVDERARLEAAGERDGEEGRG